MAVRYRDTAGRYVSSSRWQAGIGLYTRSIIDPSAIMRDVSSQVEGELGRRLKAYARSMQRSARTVSSIEAINRDVAKGAQRAVIEAYGASGIGRRKPYRQNDIGKLRRYSGGAMERALSDPQFAITRGRTIYFGNVSMLDRKAKQWYRLNFGALPRGSKDPDVGKMKFPRSMGGRTSRRSASLNGFKPSPRFSVPNSGIGIWSSTFLAGSQFGEIKAVANGTRGKGALYLGGVRVKGSANGRAPFFKAKPSMGIEGKRFIDAGARYINEQYPRRLSREFRKWNASAIRSVAR